MTCRTLASLAHLARRVRSFALLAKHVVTSKIEHRIYCWCIHSEWVHFQARLVLLLRRIDSKPSKQPTKSHWGCILQLVRVVLIWGDMSIQFDSGCCFSFLARCTHSWKACEGGYRARTLALDVLHPLDCSNPETLRLKPGSHLVFIFLFNWWWTITQLGR